MIDEQLVGWSHSCRRHAPADQDRIGADTRAAAETATPPLIGRQSFNRWAVALLATRLSVCPAIATPDRRTSR